MEKGLNFRTEKGQQDYYNAYDKSLELFTIPLEDRYIDTSFGITHLLCYGDMNNPPIVLLHAASCGATIWYPNMEKLGKKYRVYALDLITESSKSILTKKIKSNSDNGTWLNETFNALGLDKIYLCGLSIGGWTAANYAGYYPDKVKKLILLSPIQTFSKMYFSYFFKIMKMGFHPTRENVENYIGWGNAKEKPLPKCIIDQFAISVMNINSNACFPKWLKEEHLHKITMPVLLMFGKNEFAFSIAKASKRANKNISKLNLKVIDNASHLLSVSAPELINSSILNFCSE